MDSKNCLIFKYYSKSRATATAGSPATEETLAVKVRHQQQGSITAGSQRQQGQRRLQQQGRQNHQGTSIRRTSTPKEKVAKAKALSTAGTLRTHTQKL